MHASILFASAHSIIDFSNGASVATLDVLQGLTEAGFGCQAICTPKPDDEDEICFERIVSQLREPYKVRESVCGNKTARVLYTRRSDAPITVVRLPSTRRVRQSPEEVQTVLQFFEKFVDINPPDVVLTYGGDAVTVGMIAAAKRRRIPVVFLIHNFAYLRSNPFALVDYCIIPAKFTQQFYRQFAGVHCRSISVPVNWEREVRGTVQGVRPVHPGGQTCYHPGGQTCYQVCSCHATVSLFQLRTCHDAYASSTPVRSTI